MIVGTFYGPTLGVFTLGALFPFANAKVSRELLFFVISGISQLDYNLLS